MMKIKYIAQRVVTSGLCLISLLSLPIAAWSQAAPAGASPEWRAFYEQMAAIKAQGGFGKMPALDDLNGWRLYQRETNEMMKRMGMPTLSRLAPKLTVRMINGVSVLDVEPQHYHASRKIIIYTHGGGYTINSADSTAASAALMAAATGMRVVSVDYTIAPFGKWPVVTDQVLAVFKGLIAEGHPLKSMGIYGDSAGGGLAAASVLKMRDQRLGMPAAVVLWSPWVDVTESGDTNATLKSVDPILSDFDGMVNARAYADDKDFKNPYVSPLYADFSQGFPATLIQAGTREKLLSDAVRLNRVMDDAGREVHLDLYDGMPHVFQVLVPQSVEAQRAIDKSAAFFKQHLR